MGEGRGVPGGVGREVKLVIVGEPRTKKNSPRIARNRRTGARFVLPSEASEDWKAMAIEQLVRIMGNRPWRALDGPLHVKALFYRARNVGDLDNFCAAVGDFLQAAKVIKNDSQIESWDHSRKLIDKSNPRVEIEITTYEEVTE